jgi:midasin
MVNERGLVEGEAMIVHAHPNFRLFLIVDPDHGEVSRAMRNRGVELFLLQPDWPQSAANESPILGELLLLILIA